jgi:hypothetical protein
MNHKLRILLIILNVFLAFTAIAGGMGLLTGINAPPVGMLSNSPFSSYVVPALALLVLVGGTASAAAIMLVGKHRLASDAALTAGFAIMIFEAVEAVVIGSPEGIARILQAFYFTVGFLIAFIAWRSGVGRIVASPSDDSAARRKP